MAFLFRIVPKVGPFRSVDFKAPTAQTERLFMQSFNGTLDLYRTLLEEQQNGHLSMANTDFDTGSPTREGEYSLADETYAKLLRDLAKKGFSGVTPELRANLLSFYRDPKPPVTVSKKAKSDQKGMAETLAALEQLRALDIPGHSATPATARDRADGDGARGPLRPNGSR
jgi:hypothetical protein